MEATRHFRFATLSETQGPTKWEAINESSNDSNGLRSFVLGRSCPRSDRADAGAGCGQLCSSPNVPHATRPMAAVAAPWESNWASTDLRADAVQKQTDAQLTDSITNGKGAKMPAYKGKITDDQIKGLVGYIRDLAKK